MINSYVCLDVETTGLNPKEDRIIEIGAVKVRDGQIIETFQCLINPGRKLEERIVALTGITDEMLKQAPYIQEVAARFHGFCEDLPLLGHQLIFDYSFIKRVMVDEKLVFEKKGLDTLKIARVYLPELESRSLGYLSKYYHLEHSAHRALGDAMVTHQLYQILCKEFYDKAILEGTKVFKESPLVYSVKRQTPITVAQKEQVLRYCQKLGITLDRDIHQMTRSEASKFLEKYRLEYKASL